ncbi:Serpin A12 [Manis pentadactyla]|nr:Serpin A12 [Manis pentadactyla]
MNPMLSLGLLLAGFLTVEGLLNPNFSPTNHGTWSQAQTRDGKEAAQELARRNAKFGLKLYRKLAAGDPNKNIFFSPLGIGIAFSILSLGAQDSTLAEIKQGFNFRNMPEKELHEGFHYLIHVLNQKNQEVELALRNALFMDQELRPQKKFMTDIKKMYNADMVVTNFQNLENTRKQINEFIRQKTQGKIKNLINNINPGTVMLLIDCVFLRARWLHQFDPKATKEEDFILNGNKTVKVPMMLHGGGYKVGRDDQLSCSILEVPYRGNITAIFILPDEGQMRHVEEALTVENLDRWSKLIKKRVVNVSLPKFSITGTYDLKKTLSHMGITKIFEEHGDLTKISPHQSLKVGEAVHKAQLQMDEKGSEAAAGSAAQALPMEMPLIITFNRPFLVIIQDDDVSSVLFMGKLTDPGKK